MPSAAETNPRTDWDAWHSDYADAGSALSARLAIVQQQIRTALATVPGRCSVLSACAGDGRDILGVLAELGNDASRIQVTLLETDPRNLERAARFCQQAGLSGVRLRDHDAGLASSYADAAPADLVLMCGVFGNVSDADVRRLIEFLPRLCRPGATLIWTRSRRSPDLTPRIRGWLADSGFTERSFTAPPDVLFSVGAHRFDGQVPDQAAQLLDERLFSFLN